MTSLARPDPLDRPVGIDAIGVYVPRLYVDLTGEWATARAPLLTRGDVDKLIGKVIEGVGVRRMAVVDAHQDCATLAAMAAKRVIDASGIDPRDIDFIAVGTETTVDQSKSMAAYVLGMLERHYGVKLAEVGAPQFQFACIGATYALEAAVNRIRAGENTKRYSLVIASDISKYPLRTAGEYTQGAGAVALLVSEDPRVLVIDRGVSGTITRDERDFFRPNGQTSAVVDGKYSIDVYLDCMEAAFDAYAKRAHARLGIGIEQLYGAVEAFFFHVPFPRMAEYAGARVLGRLWSATPEIRARLASEGVSSEVMPRKDFEKALARTALFRAAFDAKVAPSLTLAREVGNIYSGALYMGLVSFLEETRGRDLTGRRVVLGSYGSGASAKVFSGVIADGYRSLVDGLDERRALRGEHEGAGEGGQRIALSVADYERLHEQSDRERGPSLCAPRAEFVLERLGTSETAERTDVGYRYYGWVDG
jgi:hydroxymethylglutaryl-CoA synthase